MNLRKHGVALADAVQIFDGFTITVEDRREMYAEQRFISMGPCGDAVLVVAHLIGDKGDTIRLISARKAERYEARYYWQAFTKHCG